MTNVTRRELGQLGGGAVALGGTIALTGYAAAQLPQTDPALEIAAEWTAARDNLLELHNDRTLLSRAEQSERWRTNVLATVDAGKRLARVQPTTLAGAMAVLAIAIYSLDPDGMHVLHHNLPAERALMLEWLRGVQGAFPQAAKGGAA